MAATKILTEQPLCPRHNCPKDTRPEKWFDNRYCFPLGSANFWQRLEYWQQVQHPEGCWYDCPSCWRMANYAVDQLDVARKHRDDWVERLARGRRHPNGKHRGKWTLCLNYSPQWYENDYEAQEAMRLAINRLLRYYKNDIKEFRAIGEFTKAGRSHVHVYYELENGGKFTDKNLNRAYPHWDAKVKVGDGVKGGQHAPVKDEADYRGYIEKDLEVSWMDVTYPDAVQEVQVSQPPSPSDDAPA